jgi:Zn-dependent protease with chaperone function
MGLPPPEERTVILSLAFAVAVMVLSTPASVDASAASGSSTLELRGYAEYHHPGVLIVDGQRVVANEKTKIEVDTLGRARSLDEVPLGFEVKVEGQRQRDGSVLAKKIEAKPNGMAMFEADVLAATNQVERTWVEAGEVYEEGPRGQKQVVGKLEEDGPEVARVQRIMDRLVPPYVNPESLRVRVVDTKEWNASAMGNGAIWVYRGLLHDMSDDELAIILGHELAHYTHEHSRRGAKKAMWGQLAGLAGMVGAESIDSRAGRSAASMGSLLSISAWQSGYSRDVEDQADRVGLRYAYEAGFDVSRGPALWQKFRKKYGEEGTMSNFLFGSHSRPSDRIRNIQRELRLNYPDAIK